MAEDDIDKLERLLAGDDGEDGDEPEKSAVHEGDTSSSEDEERRNAFEKEYDDYGSGIKKLLRAKDDDQERKRSQPFDVDRSKGFKQKNNTAIQSEKRQKSEDVYSVPGFAVRVRNPLISGATIRERMSGRKAVSVDRVRRHVSAGDPNEDWVIAGVIVRKTLPKTSQSGSQYAIWTLSDLTVDAKTASLFLFRGAFKALWKEPVGTVVGVLNPSVLDNNDKSRDEACLSVDNPDRVMVMGASKDFGHCKSKKRNGDQCTSFVNTSQCQYCVYHVKQEYGKLSKRADLQASFSGKGPNHLRNKVLGKDTVIYGGKSYTSIPAVKSAKSLKKDDARLKSLSDYFKRENKPTPTPSCVPKRKASQIDVNVSQRLKDLKRLELLKGPAAPNESSENHSTEKDHDQSGPTRDAPNFSASSLEKFGLKKVSNVNLGLSYSEKQKHKAKLNALKWIEKNGPLNRANPNSLKGTSYGKRKLSNEPLISETEKNSPSIKHAKTGILSENFQKMLEAKSAHSELVITHDDIEQEKYFNKLEAKEAMEEKMLSTFKVPCKGVRCLKCNYTNFSAAEKCKQEKHPLKVFDTFKRFFKCGQCGNRTACLELLPMHSCKNCQSSKWQRAPMMNERKGLNIAPALSIRGEEEKFIGSVVTNGANINLLVPED